MKIKDSYTRDEIDAMSKEELGLALAGMVKGKIKNLSNAAIYEGVAWQLISDLENRDIHFSLANLIPNSDPIVYELVLRGKDVGIYSCEMSRAEAISRGYLYFLNKINNLKLE